MSVCSYDQYIPAHQTVPELDSVRGSPGCLLRTAENQLCLLSVLIQDVLYYKRNFLRVLCIHLSENLKVRTQILDCLLKLFHSIQIFADNDRADAAIPVKIQASVGAAVIMENRHLTVHLLFFGRPDPDSGNIFLLPAFQFLFVRSAVHKDGTGAALRDPVSQRRDPGI